MSGSQSSSEFRNDIPVAYPQSCDLPSCPRCGGKVGIYPWSDENDPPRWCYNYALPQKNRACRFCHEEFFPHLYASPDDAAAGWRAKVEGFQSKGFGVVVKILMATILVLGLYAATLLFIESLNCGCFS